jgi:hypothetical protein
MAKLYQKPTIVVSKVDAIVGVLFGLFEEVMAVDVDFVSSS